MMCIRDSSRARGILLTLPLLAATFLISASAAAEEPEAGAGLEADGGLSGNAEEASKSDAGVAEGGDPRENAAPAPVAEEPSNEQAVTPNAVTLSINGFGDVNYGFRFGPPASRLHADKFAAFGSDKRLKSTQSGFGAAGTDFVITGELPANLVYLAEVNLQVARGAQTEVETDVERMFIEKRFNAMLNVRTGLFFTPIGYFNRTLYARSFLMNSIQVPDLFEEELGLVPTHTVGAMAHGQFPIKHAHRLEYAVSLGNGRSFEPVGTVYARDDDGWRSGTVMLEWFAPWAQEMRFGVSSWVDRIRTFRVGSYGEQIEPGTPAAQPIGLYEIGVDLHFVMKSTWVNVMLEGIRQTHVDELGNLPPELRTTNLWGGLAEVAGNVGPNHSIHPYVRYDFVALPKDGGPYLGLRGGEGSLTKAYVPQTSMAMGGIAWDAAAYLRLKLEYSTAFTGPRERHSVVAQTAFAF